MDRRRFLLAAAASVLVLPLASAEGVAVAPIPFGAEDADRVRALLRVIYGPGHERLSVVEALEATLAYIDEDKRSTIQALPAVLDELSRVLVPTWVAWRDLPEEAQAAALADWSTSSLAFRRSVYAALRKLLLFHAYLEEHTWPEMGYPGPWLGRIDLPVHAPRFGENE